MSQAMDHENCVFCEIIFGGREASIVYENEAVLAMMDQRQANPGHVLVIPKRHFPDIYSLSQASGSAIMRCLITISRAVKRAFEPEGLSIWQSNGIGAGQEVPHVHFHIHPRRLDDNLLKVYPAKPRYPTVEALNDYARKIRSFL